MRDREGLGNIQMNYSLILYIFKIVLTSFGMAAMVCEMSRFCKCSMRFMQVTKSTFLCRCSFTTRGCSRVRNRSSGSLQTSSKAPKKNMRANGSMASLTLIVCMFFRLCSFFICHDSLKNMGKYQSLEYENEVYYLHN